MVQIQVFGSARANTRGINSVGRVTAKVKVINNPEFSKEHRTFACFNMNTDEIKIQVAKRHPLDIYRSLAHELVHYAQKCNGQELNGEDGSECENEANAKAGILLRKYTKNIKNHGY